MSGRGILHSAGVRGAAPQIPATPWIFGRNGPVLNGSFVLFGLLRAFLALMALTGRRGEAFPDGRLEIADQRGGIDGRDVLLAREDF